MDKIRKFISKALAFIYVFIFSVCKKKKVVVNNKILIIATGHMGNAVMDIDAVMAIKKIFIQEGKEVYLLCPPTIWIAFNLIEDMSGITYIGDKCYYGGYDTDFKNVYKIVNALKGYEFEKIIVTLTNDPEAHYVVAGLSFNQSYGVFDDIRHTAGGLRYYFEKYYTNKIIAPMNMHEFQRLKLLVQALGEVKYETGIRFIKPTESVTSRKKPYITIAMDSMVTARRWPNGSKCLGEAAFILVLTVVPSILLRLLEPHVYVYAACGMGQDVCLINLIYQIAEHQLQFAYIRKIILK